MLTALPFGKTFRRLGLVLALIGVLGPAAAGLVRAATLEAAPAIPDWAMAALCGPAGQSEAGGREADTPADDHRVLCPLCPVLSLTAPLVAAVGIAPASPLYRPLVLGSLVRGAPPRGGILPGAPPRGPPIAA